MISRVRKSGVLMQYRTSRSTKASRVSQEGQVVGVNHVTSWSWTPSVFSQRERGTPLTAGVRRTPGVTKGRPGVKSTICRAPTRRTAWPAGLHEEGEMCVGTQPPIRHEPITGGLHRVHLLHLGAIVGEEGGDDQLQEHPSARMEQPQEVHHGKAAPQPLHRRLAEGVL